MALSEINKTNSSSCGPEVYLVEQSERPLNVELVNSLKATKPSSASDLVNLAHAIERADEGVKSTACNKLSVIADQIRYLQEQAKKVLEDAKRDSDLHHAASNIVKKPGNIYYLYQKSSGQKFFSIISPQEWGAGLSHEYLGGYRLEVDRSWTPIDQLQAKDAENHLLDTVLHSKQGIVKAAISMDAHNSTSN